MNIKLDPYERWMVKSNLRHVPLDGLSEIVTRLKANGYPRIAAEVERVWQSSGMPEAWRELERNVDNY